MKTVSIILCLSAIAFIILFFTLGLVSRSGKATGIVDGRLSRCPDQPNCVCSEYKDNLGQYVEPIAMVQDFMPDVMASITRIISHMGGIIQTESKYYVAATFSSRFFRFVDDFEVRVDPVRKLIHIRSKSRIGYSDLGVNRKRVSLFKRLYDKKHPETD